MQLRLYILLLFSSGPVCAQMQRPVGVSNTYILHAADGFPGNDYVASFEYTPSGKVYAKDFFGNLHITGNNFIRYVPALKNVSNNTLLLVQSDSEAMLSNEQTRLVVIKNDSLRGTIAPPVKDLQLFIPFSGNKLLYGMQRKVRMLTLYRFKSGAWKKYLDIPLTSHFHYKTLWSYVMKDGRLVIVAVLPNHEGKIYEIDTAQSKLKYVAFIPSVIKQNINLFFSLHDNRWKEKKNLIKSLEGFIHSRMPHLAEVTINEINSHFISLFPYPGFVFSYGNGTHEYLTLDSDNIKSGTMLFKTKSRLNSVKINRAFPYLTVLTDGKPFRVFPFIKKYPRIYHNDNSENIFALGQDQTGRIWAGNYQNELSIIEDPIGSTHPPKITRLKRQPYPFMNAALNYEGNMYLVGESNGGILQYHMDGQGTKLPPQLPTGYYLYLAPKGRTVYYPSSESSYFPVYYCKATALGENFIQWKKLDSTAGILPFGMTSITEDTLGRIWMGHPKKGFAVYNPKIQKGISYQTQKRETPIGFISSLTDKRGTVWMGSDDRGLWYYDDYRKPPNPQNIHQLCHPLLNDVKRITAMTLYKDWLVLGCYDRICLLNLDSFYLKNKVILRYLNPQEAALTSYTEQNTMLVSKKDSAVWFSTSDMLYRWDIKSWLELPQYKVHVNTYLEDPERRKMSTRGRLELPARIHGFDLVFEYLSPDGLPRYTRTALVRKGDSLHYSEPGMESHFSFKNLTSGLYTFHLDVFEQDGTTSHYAYSFFINEYLWQHWWFWAAATFIFLLPFILLFNTSRLKALKEKEISQMNLVTLSAQFRPHFILNALNAIGADLKNNPGAESIISRLGESINLIFRHAQTQKISHSLKEEWLLVNNVIEIHRIIYLPDLQLFIEGDHLLNEFEVLEVPLGILEIHVENALLHGLRNKNTPPYILSIQIEDAGKNIYFIVTDNGIGREKAQSISGYKRHGVGTKNLNSIIKALNKHNKTKIDISYLDLSKPEETGTMVRITIPKDYFYKY